MRTNTTSTPDDPIIIRICKVLSVEDNTAGLRIKVRLEPEDGDIDKDSDLPYCLPLLPKMLHINPKVGESVLVFLSVQGRPRGARFFLGPLISQPYGMEFDPHDFTARALLPSFLNQSKGLLLPDPKLNPDNDGTLPNREDVALVGRNNSAIILKSRTDSDVSQNDELRLLCGHKKNSTGPRRTSLEFNRKDLGYIQMRYKKMKDRKGNDFASVINIVADRINLLSHQSPEQYDMNDKKELIKEKEMLNILENAHPMVYGDQLIQYLKELIEVIRTHGHNFTNEEPDLTEGQKNVLNAEERLDNMLSKTIRFN